jgi:hypothetical protein
MIFKYNTISKKAYGSILADSSGNILAATTTIISSPITSNGNVPTVNSTIIGIDNSTWTLLLNQMLLVNSTPFSYTDSAGNLMYTTGNLVDLPVDVNF